MATPRSTSRDLALIAIFAGITFALGLVPPLYVPISPVPITAQSLSCMLTGSIIGARRGGLALLLFLVLTAIGLPLLSGGRGGIGAFMGPSAGFLIGWPIVTWLIGLLTERVGAPYRVGAGLGINALGGIVVLYLFGIGGMILRTQMTLPAALLANAPFIPGDLVKVVIAALVAKGVHSAYPGLLQQRRTAGAGATVA
ncbi:biotin transporter BioY [Nigerium massiliense]|uniref:biotin transporter BioY n=1 Tax=Nigerium massiliense TaxID=1522317 RepID=UPI00058BBBEF|nr:biotin transporter BioY [Nigerium massiliense]